MGGKKTCLFVVLVILLLGSSLVVKTFARYDSSISGTPVIETAVAITKDNLSTTLNYQLNDMVPGDVKTYNFTVSNFTSPTNINEVTMNYEITILKSNNIPITATLYKNGSAVNCLDNNLICENNILIFGNTQTDNYQLVLTWDATDNSYIYNGLTDYLDVSIESLQVVE